MKTVKVNFEVDVPDDIPSVKVKQWVEFHLYKSGLSLTNPLVDIDLEANRHSVRVDV